MPSSRSSQRRRTLASYLIALAVAGAAALWIASGQLFGDSEPETEKPPAHLAAMQQVPQVRVRTQSAEPRVHEIKVQGRTSADRKVTVKAETEGEVVELLVDKGERVEQGQLIARLAERDRPAQLKEAKALLQQRRIELEAARRLNEKGYRAQTSLAEAEAQFEAAQARVRQAEVALDQTRILAPFDGEVVSRDVELGDYLREGDSVMRLIDLDPIVVAADVSERNVGQLTIGGPAEATLIDGQSVSGKVTFIASEAESATRTFRVEMEAANPDGRVRDGVTAQLAFPVRQQPAHFVSPSILTLNDEGVVGVKTVGDDGRVQFHSVDILGDRPDGVWITGLADQVTFITVGQNFVSVGQEVKPVTEAAVVESLDAGPLDLPGDAPGKPGPEARP